MILQHMFFQQVEDFQDKYRGNNSIPLFQCLQSYPLLKVIQLIQLYILPALFLAPINIYKYIKHSFKIRKIVVYQWKKRPVVKKEIQIKTRSCLLALPSVVGRIMPPSPKDVHFLIPRTCECVLIHGKGELQLQMGLNLLII